jgi:hypothetical protein
MTREAYSPDQLDQLALRFLDIASVLRKMVTSIKENDVSSVELNDRKAREYLDRLELWAHKSAADLDRKILAQRGATRARRLATEQEPKSAVKGRKRAGAKKSGR